MNTHWLKVINHSKIIPYYIRELLYSKRVRNKAYKITTLNKISLFICVNFNYGSCQMTRNITRINLKSIMWLLISYINKKHVQDHITRITENSIENFLSHLEQNCIVLTKSVTCVVHFLDLLLDEMYFHFEVEPLFDRQVVYKTRL